jgi:nicotinamide-nucleotide amidase
MLPDSTIDDAKALLGELEMMGLTLATAESCTGGLIAAALTAIPGASGTVMAGFVTYSDEAKTRMLGVPAPMIAAQGAVSEAVARQMAEGALRASKVEIAVSCTGIAGPDGGSPKKPVGLVFLACSRRLGATIAARHVFTGDRSAVRAAAVAAAFALIRRAIAEE